MSMFSTMPIRYKIPVFQPVFISSVLQNRLTKFKMAPTFIKRQFLVFILELPTLGLCHVSIFPFKLKGGGGF